MELIYFAKSKSFPGVVKIGRTDRSVEERMAELSEQDYGPTGFSGDSEWEAVRVIKVDDNETAEQIIHEHFSHLRVEDNRELFYSNDIDALVDESIELVGGIDFFNAFDSINSLFGGLSIISVVSGVTVLVRTFFPDNAEVWKVSNALNDWEKRLERKTQKADSTMAAIFYGSLWGSFSISKYVGEFVPRIIEELVKDNQANKLNDSYYKFLELQANVIGYERLEYITATALRRYRNNEVPDLFNEQWRLFEYYWAFGQIEKKLEKFNNESRNLIRKSYGLDEEECQGGARFIDD